MSVHVKSDDPELIYVTRPSYARSGLGGAVTGRRRRILARHRGKDGIVRMLESLGAGALTE
jgi:hypothetical protein